jgi:hypothetical protein
MEKSFFELFERQGCLALEVGYNSVADWNVIVYDKSGCSLAEAKQAVHVQDCSREHAFARAYIELADYLLNERGGY